MKISIIVPIFNLEVYIEKCLSSLRHQDLEVDQYEVLLINDGSTDNSENIIKEYIKDLPNFHLHTIENNGVSNARNQGINLSKGDYIMFVDGDDWLEKDILKTVYDCVKNDALELAQFAYTKILPQKNVSVQINQTDKAVSGLDFLIKTTANDFYPWRYVFSSSLLKDNSLTFNTSLSFCEDKELIIRVLSKTEKVKSFNIKTYNYNLERDSAVSKNITDRGIRDIINANYLIYKFADEHILNSDHKNYIKTHTLLELENSYYVLTTNSLWTRFWLWNSIISPLIKNIKIPRPNKLLTLKFSPYFFYFRFYLSRALYHKMKK